MNPKKKAEEKDAEHKRKLDEQVNRRKAQENDTSRGEPVWFSSWINNGILHHWVLILYGKKYELRLPSREKYKETLPDAFVAALPSIKFETKIQPWTKQQEAMKVREESIQVEGKPYAGKYYLCQIGWTTFTEAEVDAACHRIFKEFGVYVMGLHDCQTFLKDFAAVIIKPENQALDYDWFMTNVRTPYHKLQEIDADENIKNFTLYLQGLYLFGVGSLAIVAAANVNDNNNNTAAGNDDGDCCDCCSCCF